MRVYAGIDEAGYGPMFGPLVIARSVFLMAGDGSGKEEEPRCLWEVLEKGVCKKLRDKRGRIAVNDSKKLITKSAGLSHMERGLLAFAHVAGLSCKTLQDAMNTLGHDEDSKHSSLMWYIDETGGPALPAHVTEGELQISRGHLQRTCDEANVRVAQIVAAVVFEDRYNHLVDMTRSKARTTWKFVSEHLWAIWMGYGPHHPWVVVDRQGGRTDYHGLLELMFEGAQVKLIEQSQAVSRYCVIDDKVTTKRWMTISFETKSEERHMPTAVSSMAAKYLREMLMGRFNHFWAARVEGIAPTKGYIQDGRRFLEEIRPAMVQMKLPEGALVRSR